jgi:hypothetical protein
MKKQETTGSYAKSNPQILSPFGYPLPVFEDTLSIISEEGHYWQRKMIVDGKHFTLCSYFQPLSQVTPAEKLLHMIDSDASKKG